MASDDHEDTLFQELLHFLDIPEDKEKEIGQASNPLHETCSIDTSPHQSPPENHSTGSQTTGEPDANNYEGQSTNGIENYQQTKRVGRLDGDGMFDEIFQFFDEDTVEFDKSPCGRIVPFGEFMVTPIF